MARATRGYQAELDAIEIWVQRQSGQTHQNCVVILRRSDDRRAKVAGIAQPKNPV